MYISFICPFSLSLSFSLNKHHLCLSFPKTECCQEKGIPAECMFVCTKKDINLFDVYKNQKCLEHLNKYITCAAGKLPPANQS